MHTAVIPMLSFVFFLAAPTLGISHLSYINAMRDRVVNTDPSPLFSLRNPFLTDGLRHYYQTTEKTTTVPPLFNYRGDVWSPNIQQNEVKQNVDDIFSLLAGIDYPQTDDSSSQYDANNNDQQPFNHVDHQFSPHRQIAEQFHDELPNLEQQQQSVLSPQLSKPSNQLSDPFNDLPNSEQLSLLVQQLSKPTNQLSDSFIDLPTPLQQSVLPHQLAKPTNQLSDSYNILPTPLQEQSVLPHQLAKPTNHLSDSYNILPTPLQQQSVLPHQLSDLFDYVPNTDQRQSDIFKQLSNPYKPQSSPVYQQFNPTMQQSIQKDIRQLNKTTKQQINNNSNNNSQSNKNNNKTPLDFDLINNFSKNVLLVTKQAEDFVSTINKVKKIYIHNNNKPKQPSIDAKINEEELNINKIEENESSLTPMLNVLLDTNTLENVWNVTHKAESEDELLEGLMDIITGAESKAGSALTLDPVTVISLLTLAAYLIRAVYQILTVTGRSLDVADFNFPLDMSDLPQAMVNLHNWISPTDVELFNEGRKLSESKNHFSSSSSSTSSSASWIQTPGRLAALVKLKREGKHICFRRLLCLHIEDKTTSSIDLEDLFIMTVSYMYGDDEALSYYVDEALGYHGQCSRPKVNTPQCPTIILNEASKVQMFVTSAVNYFTDLLLNVNVVNSNKNHVKRDMFVD